MAVQYHNGQLYDVFQPSNNNYTISNAKLFDPKYQDYSFIPGLGHAMQIQPQEQQAQQPSAPAPVNNNLQNYINKQNSNAYRALNGGLLGYSPQDMTAGNAGGSYTTATGAPQMQMPAGLLAGAGGQLAQTGKLDPLQLALQNRSWMKNNG